MNVRAIREVSHPIDGNAPGRFQSIGRRAGRRLGLLAGLLAMATVAAAQQTEPRPGPRRLLPPAEAAGQPPPSASATPEQSPTAVEAPADGEPALLRQPLASIDLSGLGTLARGEGALPPSLWRGTAMGTVERLLPRLPLPNASPGMVELARRLLLSTAEAPAGQPTGPSLLALRAERLWAAGLATDLADLLRLVPPGIAEEPALARLRLDAAFIAGDEEAACATAEVMLARDPAPIWQKAAVYCYARAGDESRAGLFTDMLRETQSEDQAFFRLLEAVAGRRGRPPELPKQAEPLHLAMLRAAGRPVPFDRLLQVGPAAVLAAALAGDSPAELKLEAAERAVALNTLRPAELAKAYAEANFNAEDRGDPLKRSRELGGARGVALLLQAAALQPAGRAQFLAEALRLGRDNGRFLAVGAALLPALRELAVEPAARAVAADAVRLLAIADDGQAAQRWHALLPAGEALAAQLALLLAFAGDGGALENERFEAWWKAQPGTSPERRQGRLAVLLASLQGLGQPLPPAATALVLDHLNATEDNVAPLGLRQALQAAVEQKRLGETIALGLIALGERGPGGASATTLQAVLAAWNTAGLRTEARRLALEALVAQSF